MTHITRWILRCVVPALLAGRLSAQQPLLGGPQVGVIVDGDHLRVVTGVAGAALAGVPMTLAAGLGDIVVSPSQNYLIGTGADGRLVLHASQLNRPLTLDTAGRVFLSRTGSVMAVVSNDSSQLQVWSRVPESPALAWQCTLPADSKISSLAVSDDGMVVAAVLSSGAQDTVWRVTSESQSAMMVADHVGGIAFAANSTDAIIADAGQRRVLMIKDAAGKAVQVVLANAPAEAGTPVGVVTSADGSSIYVATTDPGGVMTLGAEAAMSFVPCACSPSGISAIGTAAFQLTQAPDPVIWLFQHNQAGARIFFVSQSLIPKKANTLRRIER